jgi:hypothetical protein
MVNSIMKLNFYCDESGHLENDNVPVMVLGSVWCAGHKAGEIASRIREIKVKHGFPPNFEIKWTKVSPAEPDLYIALLDYFFDDDDIHFRAVVVPDKSKLNHIKNHQDHNTWYYKMYYVLLRTLVDPEAEHYIYLDIKDTRGGEKVAKLHEVLANASADFDRRIIRRIQQVRSHEVEQIQLADLLIGAISYANRGLASNSAKVAFVRRMQERSKLSLTKTTLVRAEKVNILIWEAS